jgi:tetratricopeptide (TPR) repeat protein
MATDSSLDDRIAVLVPEVSDDLRDGVQNALRTLRDAGDVPGAIVVVSRLVEGQRGLIGSIASASNHRLKGHNLESQIEELLQKGIVPGEIASDLHWIRVRANKARHNIERAALTTNDAEIALDRALRVIEWFYCECKDGPSLPTIYSADPATPLTAHATVTQMMEAFMRAQRADGEQLSRLQAELERLRVQQAAADRRRREMVRERVVGPVPSAVAEHFKDRVPELRSLQKQLADENLRLVLVCGRGGMGKTALITKLLHDVQQDFTLRLDEATAEVDSIVYVVLRQSEFRSPDKIIELICRTLEPDAAAEMRGKWQEKTSLADKLEFLFRRAVGARRCLIVLDNFEDVLDEQNSIREEFADLGQFVEKCLEYDHGARLIATSRRTLVLAPELEGRIGSRRSELPLDKGLPEAEAIELLRELDTDGRLGIKDAADEVLRRIVRRCHGIPRTIETLVGTLRQRRTLTLARLIADETVFTRLMDNPARELYESLTAEGRLTMQALAVYDRAIPAAAVRYLLPALAVDEILDALVRNYVVAYDRDRFSLHPLDQQYAYRQIPEAEGEYARPALHSSAADFFRELRKPRSEWKTINDLEPQLQEFHHLVQAGLYDSACEVMRAIDFNYLLLWGYAQLVLELHTQLVKHLTDKRLMSFNLGRLGIACYSLGETGRAIEYGEQALEIAREIGNRWDEGAAIGNLGIAYNVLGDTRRAIEYYEQGLEIAREIGDRRGEGIRLGNLGIAYHDLGETSRAIEYYEQALVIDREIGSRRGEFNQLDNLGEVAKRIGDFVQSILYYQNALAIAREIGDKLGMSHCLEGLGYSHHHLGNLADARSCYEEALALDMPETAYNCAVKLGLLCLEEDNSKEAQSYFARGIALCQGLLAKTPNLYEPLYALALAQLGSRKPDEALATYKQALDTCSARGVVQDALQDLQLLERAAQPVDGLQEAKALLEAAISEH